MFLRQGFRVKLIALVLVLALIVPILAACGDNNEEKTATPAATTPAATTPAATKPAATTPAATTPAATKPAVKSDKPVKIGVIIDYSGPAAMAGWLADGVISFADWYWNEKQGGINVGGVKRPVEFLKYDTAGQVSTASAVTKKALLDGVSAVTMGGVSNQFAYPIADVTDPAGVLYSTFLTEPALFTDYKWAVCSFYNMRARTELTAKLVVEKLRPKTLGVLCLQLETDRVQANGVKEAIQALDPDVKVVYETYFPMDAKDFSPYLTKIKFANPDVLLVTLTGATSGSVAKQMKELGGWGDIQVVAMSEGTNDAIGPNTEGWLAPMMYATGYGTPAALEFGKLWAEKCTLDSAWCKKYSPKGSDPLPNHPILYNSILVAIKAIEMAGTDDPVQVAKAARSGKLELDTPQGYLKIGTDGESNLVGFYVRYTNGKPIPLE
ncbi:MAG: ABC transporter substrate-binding protein [Dehalococcoidia bacterium]